MHHRRTVRTLRRHLWLSGSIATLCFAVVVVLAPFVPILLSIGFSVGREGLPGSEAIDRARHSGSTLSLALWPLLPLALIASIVTANVLFERMREPLVRFVRCYEAIAEGVVPPQIGVRATDYLADEADALNGMIAALRRRQVVRNEAVARLEEAIVDLAMREVPEAILSDLQEIAKSLSAPLARDSRDPVIGRSPR